MSPLRLSAVLLLAFGAAQLSAADPKASHREWQTYHGDYGGTHYSELDQINRTNVKRLELAWSWKSGDVGTSIQCNPIIVNGVMFVTTGQLHVAALNATNGALLWRFDPWHGARGSGVNRGVSYWTDGKGD
ncbi:MAG: pyrroloquinoline quinone-dependent dehydrogenase, partial [Opitutaceae bacterium]|nr:pyrroloquinoline quinone-dependent dehydrogenase [Opitutaceae bacterium]